MATANDIFNRVLNTKQGRPFTPENGMDETALIVNYLDKLHAAYEAIGAMWSVQDPWRRRASMTRIRVDKVLDKIEDNLDREYRALRDAAVRKDAQAFQLHGSRVDQAIQVLQDRFKALLADGSRLAAQPPPPPAPAPPAPQPPPKPKIPQPEQRGLEFNVF